MSIWDLTTADAHTGRDPTAPEVILSPDSHWCAEKRWFWDWIVLILYDTGYGEWLRADGAESLGVFQETAGQRRLAAGGPERCGRALTSPRPDLVGRNAASVAPPGRW